MARSKNDIKCGAAILRICTQTARGTEKTKQVKQYDGMVYLLNPEHNTPYTNTQVAELLEQRKQEFPALAVSADLLLEDILRRATAHPNAPYHLSVRASTAEKARHHANKELLPKMQPLIRLIYEPYALLGVSNGSMTVAEYVQHMGDMLFISQGEAKAKRLMTVTSTVILPAIGSMTIASLASDRNNISKNKAVQSINRKLSSSSAKSTKRSDTQMAFELLLESLMARGAHIHASPHTLAKLIRQQKRRNTAIRPRLLANHLSSETRDAFFQYLCDTQQYQVLLWIACIYSGITEDELCALCFGDFEKMGFGNGAEAYTVLIVRIARSNSKRISNIGLTNEDFPPSAYRRIVLVPWFSSVVHALLVQLQQEGIEAGQIAQRYIASQGSRRLNPQQVRSIIQASMQESGCFSPEAIPRTKHGDTIVEDVHKPDAALLRRDALYLYKECACMTEQLVDASFGLRAMDVDESHYLDVLGDDMVRRRVIMMRRMPMPAFAQASLRRPQTIIYEVSNHRRQPTTVTLQANYGVNVVFDIKAEKGKEDKHEKR